MPACDTCQPRRATLSHSNTACWTESNDSDLHAQELIALIRNHPHVTDRRKGIPCKFNLIPFNPFPASGLLRSSTERVMHFAKKLSDAGIVTTVRRTRGDDIDAACGQLAGEVKDRTRVTHPD